MINTQKLQCTIQTKGFWPTQFTIPESLTIITNINKGELVMYGLNKGSKSKSSYIILSGATEDILDFIEKYFYVDNNTEIHLTLLVSFSLECNFELSQNEISRLAKLNIPLAITCYEG